MSKELSSMLDRLLNGEALTEAEAYRPDEAVRRR